MSAANRPIARLPLVIFTDLITHHQQRQTTDNDEANIEKNENNNDNISNPSTLRSSICNKLKKQDATLTLPLIGGIVANNNNNSSEKCITTIGQLVNTSPIVLLRLLDPILTYDECLLFLHRVHLLCCVPPRTALTILRQQATTLTDTNNNKSILDNSTNENYDCTHHSSSSSSNDDISTMLSNIRTTRYLKSDVPSLDNSLRGGIPFGFITEILGRSGVGKTQLAMQLCVTAAKYGYGSLYIDTEKKLKLQRLEEIAKERYLSQTHASTENNDRLYNSSYKRSAMKHYYQSPKDVLENVTIHSPTSTTELLSCLTNLEEEIVLWNHEATKYGHTSTMNDNQQLLLQEPYSNIHTHECKFPIRLIILDSIAAPARRDFGAEGAAQRVQSIFKCAQLLKRIADQLHIAVVVINQVGFADSTKIMGTTADEQIIEDPYRNDVIDVGGDGYKSWISATNDNIRPITRTSDEVSGKSTDSVSVSAALGISWHHCVTTRIILEHEMDPHSVSDEFYHTTLSKNTYNNYNNTTNNELNSLKRKADKLLERGHMRKATIVKSNLIGRSHCIYYEINKMGFVENS